MYIFPWWSNRFRDYKLHTDNQPDIQTTKYILPLFDDNDAVGTKRVDDHISLISDNFFYAFYINKGTVLLIN